MQGKVGALWKFAERSCCGAGNRERRCVMRCDETSSDWLGRGWGGLAGNSEECACPCIDTQT